MNLMPGLPDPILTASIYCADHLDDVVFRALRPFRDSAQEAVYGAPFFMWLVRYGRSGEHIKIRIHSSPEHRPILRRILEDKVHELFATLPLSSSTRENWPGAQAIDPEDCVEQLYSDHSILWTTYRRSHVSLGPSPLLEDDRYVELCTLCLAVAANLLFSLQSHFSGELAYRYRHSSLIKAVAAGIDALGLAPEEAARYLSYHRDWLIRVCALKNWWDHEKAERVIELFDQRVEAQFLLKSTITFMERVTGDRRDQLNREWRVRLRELFLYVSELGAHTKDQLDPFAALQWYPPLFKVLQGLSNQLGLRLFDEAFVYHTLLLALKHRDSLEISTGYSDGERDLQAGLQ